MITTVIKTDAENTNVNINVNENHFVPSQIAMYTIQNFYIDVPHSMLIEEKGIYYFHGFLPQED